MAIKIFLAGFLLRRIKFYGGNNLLKNYFAFVYFKEYNTSKINSNKTIPLGIFLRLYNF